MEVMSLLLSSIIVVIAILLFVKIITDFDMISAKIKVMIVIIIVIILNILAYKYTTGANKTLINIIIYLFLIKNLYNITLNKSIIIIIFFTLLLIPPELFILIIMKTLNLPKEYFYDSFAGSLISNMIVYSTMILITYILRKTLNKLLSITMKINTKIVFFAILSFISIIEFFFEIITNYRIDAKLSFYILEMIAFMITLIVIINQENKNTKMKTEYNKLLEFMETYEIELENQRILKHEYKNQLITIKSKIIDNDKKKNIIDYIDNILGNDTKFSQEEYTKLKYLPANGIKALFYFKISEAKNKGINVGMNISSNTKNSILKDLSAKDFKDLGILIGVYLDNAIEASVKSQNKLLGIEMYNTEEGIMIIISNSYQGIIEENKIGKTRFSTKGKGRGYGLMLVSSTLRHNKKFRTEREITNKIYTQKILIKK